MVNRYSIRVFRTVLISTLAVCCTIGTLACLQQRPGAAESGTEELHDEAGVPPSHGRVQSVESILRDYSDYQVVASMNGAFSEPEERETLVLLHAPHYTDDPARREILDRLVWIPNSMALQEHFDEPFLSMGYTTDQFEMLTPFIDSLGSRHPVFGVTDLTGDATDELLVLSTHGMGTSLLIVTVANGQLRYLLRGQESMNVIMSMRLVSPPGEVPIRFRLEGLQTREGTADDTDTESPWRWAEYAWDEESGEFVVSGAGILDEEPGD